MSDNQTYNEKRLLSRIAEGDEQAMKQFFDGYYSRLYYFAITLINDDVEAEDTAQEAILSFWQRKEQFMDQDIKQAEAFLFTVARNRCYNYIRDKKRHTKKLTHLGERLQFIDETLELTIIEEDIFNRIFEEIQQLSAPQVSLLKMIFIENLETAEIAAKLDITPNNVRIQKARAMEKLRVALLKKRLLTEILIFFF